MSRQSPGRGRAWAPAAPRRPTRTSRRRPSRASRCAAAMTSAMALSARHVGMAISRGLDRGLSWPRQAEAPASWHRAGDECPSLSTRGDRRLRRAQPATARHRRAVRRVASRRAGRSSGTQPRAKFRSSPSAQAIASVHGLPALGDAGDHLGVDRLDIGLHRRLRRRRGEGDRQLPLLVRLVRVVVGEAGRWPLGLPDLEVGHALEGRDVVARGRRRLPFGAAAVRGTLQQRLRRRLVLREAPDAPEEGRKGVNRPTAPAGKGTDQHFSATCGASRFATAQAEGGLKISADLPEMTPRGCSTHAVQGPRHRPAAASTAG